MASSNHRVYRCGWCHASSLTFRSRCGTCRREGFVVPTDLGVGARKVGPLGARIHTLADEDDVPEVRLPTGLEVVDRVLSGGFIVPSCNLLAGAPGAGKTSLLLLILSAMRERTLYATAEQTGAALRRAAKRFGLTAKLGDIHVLSVQDALEAERVDPERMLPGSKARLIFDHLAAYKPKFAVIDSVDDTVAGAGERDEHAAKWKFFDRCHRFAHANDCVLVVVSHLNADDKVEGKRKNQHKTDGNFLLEVVEETDERRLRAAKNRDGSTSRHAYFAMTDHGLVALPKTEEDARAEAREKGRGSGRKRGGGEE